MISNNKGDNYTERPIGFAVDSARESDAPPSYYAAQAQPGYGPTTQAYVGPPHGSQTVVLITESGQAESGDDGQFVFDDKSIRLAFIRKVYAILTVQLLLTFGVIAVFTFVDSVSDWARANYWVYMVAMLTVFIMVLVLACFVEVRRHAPYNIIFLLIFTLVEGVALGSVCVYFSVSSVWIAAAICILLVAALTLFAMQTRIDFTLMHGIFFVLSLCFLTTLLICIMIPSYWTYILYAGLGACIFSIYVVFDTQMMLGGKHKYSISPEEYIFAALNLYLDIVNLFLYVLMLVGGARKG